MNQPYRTNRGIRCFLMVTLTLLVTIGTLTQGMATAAQRNDLPQPRSGLYGDLPSNIRYQSSVGGLDRPDRDPTQPPRCDAAHDGDTWVDLDGDVWECMYVPGLGWMWVLRSGCGANPIEIIPRDQSPRPDRC